MDFGIIIMARVNQIFQKFVSAGIRKENIDIKTEEVRRKEKREDRAL
jgi:hypothetical protein